MVYISLSISVTWTTKKQSHVSACLDAGCFPRLHVTSAVNPTWPECPRIPGVRERFLHRLESNYDGQTNTLEDRQQKRETVALLPTKTQHRGWYVRSTVLTFAAKLMEEEGMMLGNHSVWKACHGCRQIVSDVRASTLMFDISLRENSSQSCRPRTCRLIRTIKTNYSTIFTSLHTSRDSANMYMCGLR